jgi:hypothetical protein
MIARNALMTVQSVKLIVNTIRADLVERDREACANADECCFSSEDCKEASTAFME